MTRNAYLAHGPDRAAAQRERDAAFIRVSLVRRMTILGAGALTAALAVVVSAVAPGRSLGARTPEHAQTTVAGRTAAHTAAVKMPPLARPSQLGLQAPGAAPQPAPQTPQPQPPPQQAAPAPAPASPAPVSGGS